MISCLEGRRAGKTTALLNQARKESKSIVVGFSINSTRGLFHTALDQFEGQIDKAYSIELKIVFKDGSIMDFYPYNLVVNNKINAPKFIDELPTILDQLFRNVKMFNGTTERMYLGKSSLLSDEYLESMKELMGVKAFKKEYECEFDDGDKE